MSYATTTTTTTSRKLRKYFADKGFFEKLVVWLQNMFIEHYYIILYAKKNIHKNNDRNYVITKMCL